MCPWQETNAGTKLLPYSIVSRIFLVTLSLCALTADLLMYSHTWNTTDEPKIPLALVAGLFILTEVLVTIYGSVFSLRSKHLPAIMDELRRRVESVPLVVRTLRCCCVWYTVCFNGFLVILTYITVQRYQNVWYQKEVIFGFEFYSVYGLVLQTALLHGISAVALAFSGSFVILAVTLGSAFRQIGYEYEAHYRMYKTDRIDFQELTAGITKGRHEHLALSDIVRRLDTIYAPSSLVSLILEVLLVVILVDIVIGVTPSKIGYMFTNNTTDLLLCSLMALANLFLLIQRITAAAYTHTQAHSVVVILRTMSEELGSKIDGLEVLINRTMRRIHDCPVVFTAGNIFTLNTELILSVSGILITYVLVLYEMNSKDDRHYMLPCNCTTKFP
ncbi:uncharacterized protein LOC129594620 [Paramacrobiotus metropolitanus]|uniref:uncharacterized protein LOC129594620 n=1 Tax=Paramacrobiotus metropolitanus TaxID=2943436 RepID=UPI0024465789|nr:uncharacterized protein LOC129594620 [Paramacrobiotus metropolitanus]